MFESPSVPSREPRPDPPVWRDSPPARAVRGAVGVPQRREVRAVEIDREERELTVVASDETMDRFGDIIRVDGWELKNFRRNPLLLAFHQNDEPIGTVPKIWTEGTQLLARARLAAAGVSEIADKIWRLVEARILRAVSVGFVPTKRPKDLEDDEGRWIGFEFIGQELLELSIVSVPANPEALALSRSLQLPPEWEARLFTVPRGHSTARARLELEKLRAVTVRGNDPLPIRTVPP